MALPPCEDGGAHDRRQAGNRRVGGRRLPAHNGRITALSGPMGNPFASVGLASHYSRFRVANRLLLTGHSHQAWPDVAFDAQQKAWLDAATLVDQKWERAAVVANDVRTGWRRLLNDPS